MALIRIGAGDVQLDQPLGFAIFSHSGKLLLSEGQRIHSERQLERLFAEGAFRDDAVQSSPDRRDARHEAANRPLVSTADHRPADSSAGFAPAPFPLLPDAFEGFQLSVAGEKQQAIRASYVGVVAGQGLIVSAPSGDALQPGVVVHGRLLYGRDVYAFDSRVVSRSAEIAGIVLLEFPQSVRKQRVRRHRRVNVTMPARVVRNDSTGFDAKVVNVSIDGVGLSVAGQPLKSGEYFRLAVRIAAEGRVHALMLNCIAQNVRPHGDGFLVGAQFHAATADAKAVLKSFVFETATGSTL